MDPAYKASASTTAATAAASLDVAAMLPQSPLRRGTGHRRAQSEILLGGALPDDLTFDADLGVVGEAGGGDEYEEYDDEDEEEGAGGSGAGGSRVFEMFLENSGGLAEQAESSPHPHQQAPPARPRHQHSVSMDGSTSLGSAAVGMAGRSGADAKKAISDAKLAELALVDPKRAKRILANRQSAARSKERKMRYIAELERKVQTLQTEATALSAQLAMLQRETSGLTSENGDLKKRVQTMDQQVRLQDALNDRLRDEINQLKVATGQVNADIGKTGNFGLSSYGGNKQLKVATGQVNADIGKTGNFGLSSYGGNKQLMVATGQVNANIGKMGNFGLSSYGGNPQNYQHTQIQSLLAAQQLQRLQIHSQQQQTHLQQHLCTAQQHQLLQEVLPFPGDLKMKGLATTSRSQNAGASDGHAVKSEP